MLGWVKWNYRLQKNSDEVWYVKVQVKVTICACHFPVTNHQPTILKAEPYVKMAWSLACVSKIIAFITLLLSSLELLQGKHDYTNSKKHTSKIYNNLPLSLQFAKRWVIDWELNIGWDFIVYNGCLIIYISHCKRDFVYCHKIFCYLSKEWPLQVIELHYL